MEYITQSIGLLFQLDVLVGLMVGVVGGMIIGALPGFSAAMGVALLIPVTYGMSPVAGLVMLVSVYTSSIYGGSITATLCHTPGTPASAATALDGYKMTQNGRGMEAVGVATIASMVGGVVGAIALLTLSPVLGAFSLKFSSLEYFMLSIFGLTIIASLAGESVVKGLFSGILGLFLGTVGVDSLSGTPRMTFGMIPLEDGIQFVPALIGLFSISQVLIISVDIFKGKKSILMEGATAHARVLPPWNETKTIIPSIARSSIIGTIIGIVPAAGASVSSWVCYSLAKKFSKHPEKFGNGSFEGIAASEAANNAATGGALVPLITLGLPGSSVAAILLGGLMVHGLVPGSSMFNAENGPTTYAIVLGFMVANILMGVIGLLISRYVAKVSTVPMAILGPVIVCLSAVGTFAIRNNMFDVYVMLIFGIIGYILRETGFATAPLVLGMVLSEICENNWRRSMILSKGDIFQYFIHRPISMVLALLVILSLFSPVLMKFVNKKSKEGLTA